MALSIIGSVDCLVSSSSVVERILLCQLTQSWPLTPGGRQNQCTVGLEWPDLGQNHEGSLQYPDHLLLALLQGGVCVQLSGLDLELRESERAVIFTSLHPWVPPIDLTSHKRSQERVICINQIVG